MILRPRMITESVLLFFEVILEDVMLSYETVGAEVIIFVCNFCMESGQMMYRRFQG